MQGVTVLPTAGPVDGSVPSELLQYGAEEGRCKTPCECVWCYGADDDLQPRPTCADVIGDEMWYGPKEGTYQGRVEQDRNRGSISIVMREKGKEFHDHRVRRRVWDQQSCITLD
jgi:hypothetical protein